MPTLEIITIGNRAAARRNSRHQFHLYCTDSQRHGIDFIESPPSAIMPTGFLQQLKKPLTELTSSSRLAAWGRPSMIPPRQAVADAADQELVFLPALWEQILERFKAYGRQPTENNKRQAYVPAEAIPIHTRWGLHRVLSSRSVTPAWSPSPAFQRDETGSGSVHHPIPDPQIRSAIPNHQSDCPACRFHGRIGD